MAWSIPPATFKKYHRVAALIVALVTTAILPIVSTNPFVLVFGPEAYPGEFEIWTVASRTVVWGLLWKPRDLLVCLFIAFTVWGFLGSYAELALFSAVTVFITNRYVYSPAIG